MVLEHIGIVIPAMNEERYLGKLLLDIKNQKFRKNRVKLDVILADGGSKDRTRIIAKSHGAKIVKGFDHPGKGRNRAARYFYGDIFYVLDADIRLFDKYFIDESLEEFKSKELDCATIPIMPYWYDYPDTGFITKAVITTFFWLGNIDVDITCHGNPKANGSGMIFRTDSFKAVGGFGENVYGLEDSELALRMFRKGFKFGVIHRVTSYLSARKPLKHGRFKYFFNVIKLHHYRKVHGELTSKKVFNKITGLDDYYAVEK